MPLITQFRKIVSEDKVLDRVQDALALVLNPLLRDALRVHVYTRSAVPTASAEWHRRFVFVKDNGKAEELWVCLTTSSGQYEWRVCAVSSS